MRHSHVLVVMSVSLVLIGCSTKTESGAPLLVSPSVQPSANPAEAASIPATPGGYKLSDAEAKLDCPKLTGQMKVRIANMRAAHAQRSGTGVSQTIQSVVTPVMGGVRRGANPDSDLQLDRAKLEAFNKRLAEKNCKTLDLDAELRGEPAVPAATQKRSG